MENHNCIINFHNSTDLSKNDNQTPSYIIDIATFFKFAEVENLIQIMINLILG